MNEMNDLIKKEFPDTNDEAAFRVAFGKIMERSAFALPQKRQPNFVAPHQWGMIVHGNKVLFAVHNPEQKRLILFVYNGWH